MDFEGDEGNVIILSFSALSDFDEKDYIYVCTCDKRSEAWATCITRFIAIIEDPKIRKYYMDDPRHSDIRSRLAHIFHNARPNLSVQHLGLALMRDRERFNIFGFTRFFRYPYSHHPGLTTLLCHVGLTCSKDDMSPTTVDQFNSDFPLRDFPHLTRYCYTDGDATGLLGFIITQHLHLDYVPLGTNTREEIIIGGNPVHLSLGSYIDNPVGTLGEIIQNPNITHIAQFGTVDPMDSGSSQSAWTPWTKDIFGITFYVEKCRCCG